MKKSLLTILCTLMSTIMWAQGTGGSRQLTIQSTGGGEVAITALGTSRTVRDNEQSWTITDAIVMSGYMTANLEFSADEGYVLTSVIVNDNYNVTNYVTSKSLNISAQSSAAVAGGVDYMIGAYALNGVVGDVRIAATFEPAPTYSLRVSVNGTGGKLSTSWGEVTEETSPLIAEVQEGDNVEIAIMPDVGYNLNVLLVNNEDKTSDVTMGLTDGVLKYNFTLTEETEIFATFISTYFGSHRKSFTKKRRAVCSTHIV